MGWILVSGGLIGSGIGVQIFKVLRDLGQVELLVTLCYVFFLGIIGSLMLWESVRALIRSNNNFVYPENLIKKFSKYLDIEAINVKN